MLKRLVGVVLLITMLLGCTQDTVVYNDIAISSFTDELKKRGVEGVLEFSPLLNNDDMDYMATYVIAKFTSTRILSFFKCKTVEKAKSSLAQAMQNPKLTGQAVNGKYLMVITFYPPDDNAVNEIKASFLQHDFKTTSASSNK